jgi:hypothetical protein
MLRPRTRSADTRTLDRYRALLRADARKAPSRHAPHRRRTRQHHGAHRPTALSRCDDLSERIRRYEPPDNFFDAIVGNIPFGNYGVYDPAYRGKPALTRTIHDYFFAKALDKTRPRGILALITSHYTMDKHDSTVRRYLADRADLIGAIRLPDTAFKANAGTEVTTDIVFLQKRALGTPLAGSAWTNVTEFESLDGPLPLNEYFAARPEMMLGDMRLQGTQYRAAEPSCVGDLSPPDLARAISLLPAGIYAPPEQRSPAQLPEPIPADLDGVKDGGYSERNGEIVVRTGSSFEPLHLPAATAVRIRGMLAVRDAVRQVFKAQLEDATDDEILDARANLNKAYDAFVRRNGPLSSKDNFKSFAGDPDHPLLLSLETWNPETKRATKTPIFERRTLERYHPVEHVDTASEALTVSLNETGRIDWPRMQQVTGRAPPELQAELDTLVYRNPEGGAWETADQYLSGNVRAKLAAAQAAAALDPPMAATSRPSKASSRPTCSRATLRPGSVPPGFQAATSATLPPSSSKPMRTASKSATLRPSRPGPSKPTTPREARSPTPPPTAPRDFPRST